VTIERIVPGGAGLGHADGRTLFVPLTAPGDRVRVRIERTRGTVAFGAAVEVLAPSPQRAAPPCPVFGRCGGCDFQQLTYEAQLAAKLDILRDCLRRIGGVEPPADLAIVPSPVPFAYRSRAEWRHDTAGHRLGYLERESHRVVDVAVCPILAPPLGRALTALRADLAAGVGHTRAAEFHAAAGDADAVVAAATSKQPPIELISTVAGETYRYGADCFFQVNHAILPALLAAALRPAPPPADQRPDALALDLYCGVGLFAVPLARRFGRVLGVESYGRAAAYARNNLKVAGFPHARVEHARVEDWLASATPPGPVAFALLDPPRAGAEPGAIAALRALAPDRIAYVSCDPATLARDLKLLLADGAYRLDVVTALDMFPQTHHVETVAQLVRAG